MKNLFKYTLVLVFIFLSVLPQYLFAKVADFQFNFNNQSSYTVTIERGSFINQYIPSKCAKPGCKRSVTIPTGQTKSLVLYQLTGGGANSVINDWVIYKKKNNKILCASVIKWYAGIGPGTPHWYYSVEYESSSYLYHFKYPLCKGIKQNYTAPIPLPHFYWRYGKRYYNFTISIQDSKKK